MNLHNFFTDLLSSDKLYFYFSRPMRNNSPFPFSMCATKIKKIILSIVCRSTVDRATCNLREELTQLSSEFEYFLTCEHWLESRSSALQFECNRMCQNGFSIKLQHETFLIRAFLIIMIFHLKIHKSRMKAKFKISSRQKVSTHILLH